MQLCIFLKLRAQCTRENYTYAKNQFSIRAFSAICCYCLRYLISVCELSSIWCDRNWIALSFIFVRFDEANCFYRFVAILKNCISFKQRCGAMQYNFTIKPVISSITVQTYNIIYLWNSRTIFKLKKREKVPHSHTPPLPLP